ncbi:hypothetical protein Egran_00012 [Elaphomyces granulatus]|uniref:ATP-dependent DNA helicase n=1 Tax=Elaphomyces granulatus TaxID=519963 RepID=A0A232M814_9EURO|nr:hypothetical protein Egran_00012 [Elaphomyces granulatus]
MHERLRAPERVLNYFPVYKSDEQPEDYARVKLILHHPFREISALKQFGDTRFDSFQEAYEYCRQACVHEAMRTIKQMFEESDTSEDDEDVAQSWEALARQLPNRDVATHIEDPDRLGDRQFDREKDWMHVGRYPDLNDEFWEVMKTDFPADITARSSASPEGLERKQRQLFDLIIGHYRSVLAGENTSQLLINLDGRAGTGKSHVIMLISATLDRMAQSAGIDKPPVVRAAPTGVAAYGISGRTLHSMFRLPVGRGNAVDNFH